MIAVYLLLFPVYFLFLGKRDRGEFRKGLNDWGRGESFEGKRGRGEMGQVVEGGEVEGSGRGEGDYLGEKGACSDAKRVRG